MHKLQCCCTFVWNHSVKYGIFNGLFDGADFAAWAQAENFHDFLAGNRRLKAPYTVTLLEFGHFTAHKSEIVEEALYFRFIFRRYISLAECHQIVDIIGCIKDHTAYGRIGNHIFDQSYRTHVELDHFLHIFHFLIHREAHIAEYTRYHSCTYEIVVVKCPSEFCIPAFSHRFGYVVEQSRPSQPHIL